MTQLPLVGAKSVCQNCAKEIIWEPWFRDGKQPNPPVWSHTHSGTQSCSSRPDDWPHDRWPFAAPSPEHGQTTV
ncbi:hypothetical protein [Streptomyces sp. NPDC058661]|uniref:hypothetical protein n=1 Tax=Streptomyces sp. NPDC058661 TaxID=3346582 RepID=UPI00364CE893